VFNQSKKVKETKGGQVKCACSQVLLVIMLIAFKRQEMSVASGEWRHKGQTEG